MMRARRHARDYETRLVQRSETWLTRPQPPWTEHLALAGIVGAASVFDDQARGLGPIASFRSDRKFYMRVAFWNLSVPLAVVAAGAGVATYLLGRMLLSIGDGGELSGGLVAAGSLSIAIGGVLVALVCAEIAVRRSRTWLPTGD